jgi:hypothetical protein
MLPKRKRLKTKQRKEQSQLFALHSALKDYARFSLPSQTMSAIISEKA